MDGADPEIRLFQRKQYLSKFIENDVRPDSRALGQTRQAAISLGAITSADGSAMVKLGNTVMVCGIKAEVTRPPADRQDEGVIVPNVQLPPLCSPDFKPGPPSEEAQVLSHYLNQVLDECKVVDKTQLSICDGVYCWLLYCDVMCCNYDGNIRDAALLSLVGALKDLRIPATTYDKDTEELIVDPENTHRLNLASLPVPLTCTIFDETILLVDPTHEEESVCRGQLTIIMSGEDNISKLTKLGGPAVSFNQMNMCIESAKVRWKEINELLTNH